MSNPHDDTPRVEESHGLKSLLATICQFFTVRIHPAGWPFILIAAVGGLLLAFLWEGFAVIGLIATLYCVYFFRDPERCVPVREGLIVSPADGRVIAIEHDCGWPDELKDAPRDGKRPTRISIFLSVFDCHVIRAPAAGEIEETVYREGAFVNAALDKASEDNERLSVLMKTDTDENTRIGFTLIAGFVARRILYDIFPKKPVVTGGRVGIIRFGSRVDVYLPAGVVPMVGVGQRTLGGETILADLKSKEKARAIRLD